MKENIARNIGIIRVENVGTGYNSLAASSVIPRIKEFVPNAVRSSSGNLIPCRFNLDGTIKKGYIKIYKSFKEAEMALGHTVFEFVHVKGTSF